MKRGAIKAFREFLNKMGREGGMGRWRNGRYSQRKRDYGDYLYAQDRDKFNVELEEAMRGCYASRGFDHTKWRCPDETVKV